jgi:hypothetical protein
LVQLHTFGPAQYPFTQGVSQIPSSQRVPFHPTASLPNILDIFKISIQSQTLGAMHFPPFSQGGLQVGISQSEPEYPVPVQSQALGEGPHFPFWHVGVHVGIEHCVPSNPVPVQSHLLGDAQSPAKQGGLQTAVDKYLDIL